jgi:membrane associated rhomboid family serine protease
MIIPIRTETPIRRTPWVNFGLIFTNILIVVFFGTSSDPRFKLEWAVLNPAWPALYQFVTYQFLHGDFAHLGGNMLFLWVFGNSVNAKMGDVPYLLFYLAGGMLAAWGFAQTNPSPLLGASGSIAAVTTAYLVLFPRSRITVMYWFLIIGFFELPALIMIGLKIILWDNIIAPSFGGAGNVAYGAHLMGYFVGFVAATVMLLVRALPRDQFDMIALLRRWNQRRSMAAAMSDPKARAEAQYGRMARLEDRSPDDIAREEARMDEITDLRARISDCVNGRDLGSAAALYEQLIALDPRQCLPERVQLSVARELYATGRSPQAAAAFEQYLKRYPDRGEDGDIRLLLGIILARDLRRYEAAEPYLARAAERVTSPTRREQAARWLRDVREALGKPLPEDPPAAG